MTPVIFLSLEITDAAHQQVADNNSEEAPNHIDDRRRKPRPGRPGERALEWPSNRAAHDMWYGIRKKETTEKIRDDGEPGHVMRSALRGGREWLALCRSHPTEEIFSQGYWRVPQH